MINNDFKYFNYQWYLAGSNIPKNYYCHFSIHYYLLKKKKKIFADSDSYGEENFEGFDLEDFGPVEVERNQDNSNYDVFLMRICGHPVIR